MNLAIVLQLNHYRILRISIPRIFNLFNRYTALSIVYYFSNLLWKYNEFKIAYLDLVYKGLSLK